MAALSPRPDSATHPFSDPPQGFVNVTPRLNAANAHWATYYVHCATFRFFDWASASSGCPWNDLYYHDGLAIWAHPLVAEHLDIWMRTGQRVPPPRSNAPSPTIRKEPAMNVIVPFTFEASEVRVIHIEDSPWWVLADVCRALNLGEHKGGYSHHAAKLDDTEKKMVPRNWIDGTPMSNLGVVAQGTMNILGAKPVWAEPSIWVVSEAGLYTLILRCRDATTPGTLPHRFKKWVTAEVIPSIRKTGGYGVQRDPMEVLSDPTAMRGLLLTYSEKVLALQPKADAFDRIAGTEGLLNITEAAKALQVQPKKLFQRLSADRWIYRRAGGKNWLGYQDRVQSGLVNHKVTTVSRSDGTEKIVEQVFITPKGMAKLAETFGSAA